MNSHPRFTEGDWIAPMSRVSSYLMKLWGFGFQTAEDVFLNIAKDGMAMHILLKGLTPPHNAILSFMEGSVHFVAKVDPFNWDSASQKTCRGLPLTDNPEDCFTSILIAFEH